MAESSDQWSLSGQSSLSSSLTSISTSIDSLETDVIDFKVKVDRKLLEKMLNSSDESVESAQKFFTRASSQSGAIISFPQIWKLQALGKKDPEVRVIGNSSQVRCARKLILDIMDPYRNRVVLKIDVSFTDHSFIIGKGGKRIQSIMDATKTQIHFPDENLRVDEMKSNVVTITCDSLRNADEARQVIRLSLPLTVGFQIVVSTEKVPLLESRHPIIEYYQRRYNVLVAFNRIESTDLNTVTANIQLRGSRVHISQLQEATKALHCLFESSESLGINSKVIRIEIEISPRHQPFVRGVNNENIKAIYNRTGAIITFPDISTNSHLRSANPTTVSIKGMGLESAFIAWMQLLGFLPVVLLFDLKSEQINSQLITTLMGNQLLSIKICPKINSDKRTIMLKTEERYVDLLFEARKQILNVSEEPNTISVTPPIRQNHRCSTAMPYIPPEVMDFEPEVIRSQGVWGRHQ